MKYMCEPCGYIYDPAEGDPDGGIAPGTAFEDIPEDWCCPVCGVGKEDHPNKRAAQTSRFFLSRKKGLAEKPTLVFGFMRKHP